MMAPSASPDASAAAPRPANAVLVRSVIARPLMERIRYELELTDKMRARYPTLAHAYTTAIILRPEFEGGLGAARKAVREMLTTYARAQAHATGKPAQRFKLDRSLGDDLLLAKFAPEVVDHLRVVTDARTGPIKAIWPERWDVIIDINLKFRERQGDADPVPDQTSVRGPKANPFDDDPRKKAKQEVRACIDEAKRLCQIGDADQCVDDFKTDLSNQYVFARLGSHVLLALFDIDRERAETWADKVLQDLKTQARQPQPGDAKVQRPDPRLFRAIHQIWPDFDLGNCVHRSARTVKADAAQNAFSAFGDGITWAVADSGIDRNHPHFALHANIDPASPFHRDFTGAPGADPLVDLKGHGTHVAGIIAGQQTAALAPDALAPPYDAASRLRYAERERAADGVDTTTVALDTKSLPAIAGIAPKCKLVSLKVLDQFGYGKASNVIAAIDHVQLINNYGRDLKIHGLNLSLGHNFDASWFACGQSPLCVEVNRLVKSGVVVVVAAGNTGYGILRTMEGDRNSGLDLSINDPGNADLAITVGATHREEPHRYGVSYFSSKGPTGDGRIKPDMVAPGERIVSAAAFDSKLAKEFGGVTGFAYCESSGTSMAAPHVSGAIAAFLSIRNEFIGEPEKVKTVFSSTAVDLGRERYFQGAGLVDLLRAIQSV